MKITVTVKDCRFYAHECMRWAEETDNEEHRQGFLDMAVVWMKLAMDGNEAQRVRRGEIGDAAAFRNALDLLD
jgi:hypothetical protein